MFTPRTSWRDGKGKNGGRVLNIAERPAENVLMARMLTELPRVGQQSGLRLAGLETSHDSARGSGMVLIMPFHYNDI